MPVRQPDKLAGAFATARHGSHAMCVTDGAFEFGNRPQIVSLASQHRLPAVYGFRELVADGGLMSYGTNVPGMFRRAAGHMVRVLQGAKPSDLPVEQPTSFDLMIDVNTAASLGIMLPESLNARVTEVLR
jgi:putative tryptophan/tyrosine transport system substrate-binding protein